MSFKVKTKNRNPINTKKTLDAVHLNIINSFEKNKRNIDNYKLELNVINEKIEKINKKFKDKKLQSECMYLQREIWDLDDRKRELENIIKNINNNEDEKKYLLETGNILKQYYNINEDEPTKKDKIMKKNKKKKSVLEWIEHDSKKNIYYDLNTGNAILNLKKKITNSEEKRKTEKNNNTNNQKDSLDKINNSINTNNNILKDYNINSSLAKLHQNNNSNQNNLENSSKTKIQNIKSKKKLYQIYMMTIDNEIYLEDSENEDEDVNDICDVCSCEMLLEQNTGTLLCPNCGIQEQVLIDSDKPSYKDPPKEVTSFCYKRINHLNEFLAQFQAKETTDIPEEIYNEILVEIKKQRITNMADITPEKMRLILRKVKRNDYYEHVPYIINQLNGLPPPIISPEVEEIIRNMFKEIQIPFEKFCPEKRKNFLSYNYVMYKFFELLELDEYLSCFQLLKSRNKLHQQDIIWKNICQVVKWQFIPSL